MTTTCRFCGCPVEIPLPEDERMQRFIRTLATRACCNRCADYQREQRDLGERLGKVGLGYKHTEDKDTRETLSRAAKAIMVRMVQAAEEHHMIQGLSKDIPEWEDTFRQTPEAACWQARLFVRGAADLAKQTHGGTR